MKNIDEGFEGIRLPRLISDGMVLQRDAVLKIWGWAAAGDKITICFLGKSYGAETGPDGKWTAALPALEAGGPCSMVVKADNPAAAKNSVTINNILIGDVWVCSGQSNMTIPMSRVDDLYADEISRCENPALRLFTVPERYDFKTPRQDLQSGGWVSAGPESILDFTAVGYFFAKALYEKYRVPIGMINASVGGSPAEAWMSEEALRAFPVHLKDMDRLRDDAYVNRILKADEALRGSWFDRLDKADKGMCKGETAWSDARFDDSSWPVMRLPALWKDGGPGDLTGAVWFRKEIRIPASMAGKPARLLLGRIVDSDTVYVNGALIGSTSYQYPPRKYNIEKEILKKGKNIIAVRVVNPSWHGGFIADKPYRLEAGGRSIDLTGEWRYSVGAAAGPLPEQIFFQYKPLGLFNGMIAPLLDYAVKGVIWYQGEANTSQPAGYHRLFSSLIADWRRKWGQGNFPFLYVQLPNYMPADDLPSESNWALLREEQLKTLDMPNTSMAVAIDLGEWNDLHPLNKKDVGVRLSLSARYLAYGDKEVVCSGPIYRSMKIEGSKIAIEFDNTGGGLTVRGRGGLKHFAIAGPDQSFVWAKARIRGRRVQVWSARVPEPAAVRYAWADNPQGANLYNREGLPASPFRTDDW